MSSRARRILDLALVLSLSAILTSLLYSSTVGNGFYYDDYHFVHPYTVESVLATFRGPWDAAGVEKPYYRPLTICFYAARFAVLGLNAHAHHVASLLMFVTAAFLFGTLASRVGGSRTAGLIGTAVFTVHPGMPYSSVAWVTNQMHLAELLVVLGALLWWFYVRARTAGWWMPLLAFQAVAVLIKEDGIMLVPAVVALHTLRKYLVERDLPHVPWPFLGAAVCLAGGLLANRRWALRSVQSHQLPSWDQAWDNWRRGLEGAFRLVPAKRPWQPTASWFASFALVVAVLLWRWLSRGARFAIIAGAAIGVLFVLPFAFIIKAEQLHLVTTGAALCLSAALAGLIDALAAWRAAQLAVALMAIAGTFAMALVTRNITQDFEPYGPIVRYTDRIVEGWGPIPAELRDYLALKRTAPSSDRPDPDPARALPVVAFGLHSRERSPDGIPLRWMAGPIADVFVVRTVRLLSFAVRHERGAFGEPAHVRLEADGTVVADTILDDGRWHHFDVVLRRGVWLGAGGRHRVQIRLDHAWIPAKVIPGSGDGRTLGLQVGDFQTR